MWSPSLVPPPADYGEHVDVVGNVFPPLPAQGAAAEGGYQPPAALAAWLGARRPGSGAVPDPVVFVGFGSMVIRDPAALVRTIEDAARLADTRVLLQSSWTDLSAVASASSGLCFFFPPLTGRLALSLWRFF